MSLEYQKHGFPLFFGACQALVIVEIAVQPVRKMKLIAIPGRAAQLLPVGASLLEVACHGNCLGR